MAEQLAANPDVSVVIPIYNAQKYLAETLTSVLAQTGIGLEVICIDDGSTDASAAIVTEFQRTDSRIQLIQQENKGLSVTRNVGISAASGRYIVFLDADDLWRTDQLTELCEFADRHNLQILLFDTEPFIDGTATDLKTRMFNGYRPRTAITVPESGLTAFAKLITNGQYQANAALYLLNREWLRETGILFNPGFIHEDNAFTFRLFLAASRVALLPIKFHNRRIRDGSIMTAQSEIVTVLGYIVAYLDMQAALAAHAIIPSDNAAIAKYLTAFYRETNLKFYVLSPDSQRDVRHRLKGYAGAVPKLRDLLRSDQIVKELETARLDAQTNYAHLKRMQEAANDNYAAYERVRDELAQIRAELAAARTG